MVVTKVLTPRSAARALNWNILAIIAGSVGAGVIVVESGLSRHIADAILYLSSGSTPLVVLVIAVGTTLLTNVVTNAAAAAILTPVALKVAVDHGPRPRPASRIDRHLHLVHVHQSVQPPVQPDGDAARRLFHCDVRALRHTAHAGESGERFSVSAGRCCRGEWHSTTPRCRNRLPEKPVSWSPAERGVADIWTWIPKLGRMDSWVHTPAPQGRPHRLPQWRGAESMVRDEHDRSALGVARVRPEHRTGRGSVRRD